MKTKINITLDKDLIEFAKIYAEEQRTSVSEVIGQFILNLKRMKEKMIQKRSCLIRSLRKPSWKRCPKFDRAR